ncbi:hypothetical protein E2C01_009744 [Portunus trituberculatus]|uniref:Uncharacterized protein n=1 Tax=Portunus trituberculatus TaxID=210409 RepID=A0A5B7D6U4_PORTR|nr:hypothetical protein [Portunus trituberculatus]
MVSDSGKKSVIIRKARQSCILWKTGNLQHFITTNSRVTLKWHFWCGCGLRASRRFPHRCQLPPRKALLKTQAGFPSVAYYERGGAPLLLLPPDLTRQSLQSVLNLTCSHTHQFSCCKLTTSFTASPTTPYSCEPAALLLLLVSVVQSKAHRKTFFHTALMQGDALSPWVA